MNSTYIFTIADTYKHEHSQNSWPEQDIYFCQSYFSHDMICLIELTEHHITCFYYRWMV